VTDIQEPRRRGNPNWTKRSPDAAPMRDVSDSRARAEARAAQVREHMGEGPGEDKFYVDPNIIPDGWDYQWKRKELLGKPDPHYAVELRRNGWEAVPADRHPELMPPGWNGAIERDGMMLMERPQVLTEEARRAEYREARGAVIAKEQQLGATPKGHLSRDADPRVRPRINKSYEPMAIPADAEYIGN